MAITPIGDLFNNVISLNYFILQDLSNVLKKVKAPNWTRFDPLNLSPKLQTFLDSKFPKTKMHLKVLRTLPPLDCTPTHFLEKCHEHKLPPCYVKKILQIIFNSLLYHLMYHPRWQVFNKLSFILFCGRMQDLDTSAITIKCAL